MKTLEGGCRETWLSKLQENTNHQYFFYYGIPLSNKFSWINDVLLYFPSNRLWKSTHKCIPNANFIGAQEIKVDAPERWDTMVTKFLSAVKLVLRTIEFDYLIKVNTTCFVNLENLEKLLEKEIDYFGVANKGKSFPVGWAVGYSRKSLLKLLSHVESGRFENLRGFDDEVVGTMMSEIGYDFVATRGVEFQELTKSNSLSNEVFIRIKAIENRTQYDYQEFLKLQMLMESKNK
jgi:hypothetical protein